MDQMLLNMKNNIFFSDFQHDSSGSVNPASPCTAWKFRCDLFYFIENCTLYNYADDNTISKAASSLDMVLANLTYDGNNAVQWFDVNGMQANPEKFQFMLLSRVPLNEQCITLGKDTVLSSEACVKVLGVMIDEKLISRNISVYYVKKQLGN